MCSCPGCTRPMATCVMTVSVSTLLTGRCYRNCLYLNCLGNKSLAKRSFRKVVLADSCCGFNLATTSSSVSYHEYVRNRACQEGRKSGLSLIGSRKFICACPCYKAMRVSLCPVPVAELCGPGVTCFPVDCRPGPVDRSICPGCPRPMAHVCDDRLRFDPLDRSMWP